MQENIFSLYFTLFVLLLGGDFFLRVVILKGGYPPGWISPGVKYTAPKSSTLEIGSGRISLQFREVFQTKLLLKSRQRQRIIFNKTKYQMAKS